jgi:hypothetical protein
MLVAEMRQQQTLRRILGRMTLEPGEIVELSMESNEFVAANKYHKKGEC